MFAISQAIAVAKEWEEAVAGPAIESGPVAQLAVSTLTELAERIGAAPGIPSAVGDDAARAISRLAAKIYADFECIRVEAGHQDDPSVCEIGATFGPLRSVVGETIDLLARYTGLSAADWKTQV